MQRVIVFYDSTFFFLLFLVCCPYRGLPTLLQGIRNGISDCMDLISLGLLAIGIKYKSTVMHTLQMKDNALSSSIYGGIVGMLVAGIHKLFAQSRAEGGCSLGHISSPLTIISEE
ncbi:MAG TPA: hypothetical protein VGW78_00105 [Candidatus Babeliales bacterium]|nr:hypothetical protein [Candidatus Babeliales bacterium]